MDLQTENPSLLFLLYVMSYNRPNKYMQNVLINKRNSLRPEKTTYIGDTGGGSTKNIRIKCFMLDFLLPTCLQKVGFFKL